MNSICLARWLCPGNRERSHHQWKLHPAGERRAPLSEEVIRAKERRGSGCRTGVYSAERSLPCRADSPFFSLQPRNRGRSLSILKTAGPSSPSISILSGETYLATICQQRCLLHIKCLFLELRVYLRLPASIPPSLALSISLTHAQ